MFPKLSEKAWDVLPVIYSVSKGITGHDINQIVVGNFMDLFDLKKYPITFERYCEFFLQQQEDGKDMEFEFDVTNSINELIAKMSEHTGKDEIIIIGEIHGWWAKGDTQWY